MLGRVVASEPELLYRVADLRREFDPARGDLFAPLLVTRRCSTASPTNGRSLRVRCRASTPQARRGRRRAEGAPRRARPIDAPVRRSRDSRRCATKSRRATRRRAAGKSDRVIVLTHDEFGHERAWSISAIAPGPLLVRACEIGAPWKPSADEVPYVEGIWRETGKGYAIELRAPLNLFGTQLAVQALDADDAIVAQTRGLAWIHTGSEALKQRLEQYAPDGVRVSVVDMHGWLLARAGSIAVATPTRLSRPAARRRRLHALDLSRAVLQRRGARRGPTDCRTECGARRSMQRAAASAARSGSSKPAASLRSCARPCRFRYGDENLGALVVEQPGEQLVQVREIALTRLLNLTLVATLFVIVVTIVFAARLSHAHPPLESRSEHGAHGRRPDRAAHSRTRKARDELGALARSYDTLLGRLQEYTNYLQTLGTKLSHELRTPLTIVSSSLDNLSSEETLPPTAQSYIERARSGTNRMHAILTALSEATRVEQSIEHTERVRFDLRELVQQHGPGVSADVRRSIASRRSCPKSRAWSKARPT